MNDQPWTLPRDPNELASSVAPARRYDALLHRKDNFAVDRGAAMDLLRILPYAEIAADENRRFIERSVRRLAGKLGVDQFLDVGCGLPTTPSVFEIAEAAEPRSRVLYVDHDEHVAVHARALMAAPGSHGTGWSDFIAGDLRRPKALVSDPRLRSMFDQRRPVAVLINAVLRFVTDEEDPYGAVETLMAAMPSGSYLALTHGTADFMTEEQREALAGLDRDVHGPLVPRTREEIAGFFVGFELVKPGLVPTADWGRPDDSEVTAEQCAAYAGIALKL
ncbi:SAM-dependent methyltransferase [Mangrovihabitans endophyticus]|uniref:S-adenosyl methyltransferase n=1 Tax=Mangrovihabitans endophyticus TaxID=1751298 RepID=A0A8J3C1J7_9ACTN|nr:SAM-dependent methyltransferase [Mangrovihabitans endophyticus]GGL01791.1 hypothetical protein GCM10012284_40470 [Mangrovihabitans endophyticus]